ncbi:MAG: YggS family pyridoxal phosphate-dependent enzyme [Bacteroidetes bacterium]|nr:YggS family pyridoxal phosphate-dependent enzyme [Bacteroidota bacterium]MCH8523172.1 YggS family pyridoxal phosphate-dependent enzyme [Balneolales bacterium]
MSSESSINAAINLDHVLSDIRTHAVEAGRNPVDILLVAVSKTKSMQEIRAVYEAGQVHFGENKVQELVPKMEEGPEDAVWHMIGALQSNKVKYMAERVDWIHSVPKLKTLKEIDKRAAEAGRVINTLIQINISEEDQKSGCEPDDLREILDEARGMKHIVVRGLMGIASFEEDLERVRPQFRLLRELRDFYATSNDGGVQLEHLSMGMTHDLEVAIQEGATMVRVGSAIFGARDY